MIFEVLLVLRVLKLCVLRAAVLALPAPSRALAAATETMMLPERLALGETTCLYTRKLTLLKALLLPFLMAISDLAKPVTASEKVKVTSSLAVRGRCQRS